MAACALIPHLVGLRILQESAIQLYQGSSRALQLIVALPCFSWPWALVLSFLCCRFTGEAPLLTGPGAGHAARIAVVLGLLDAAQRLAFSVAVGGLPPLALAAVQGFDVILTAALARLVAGQRSSPQRLLPMAAALLLIGLLAASGPLQDSPTRGAGTWALPAASAALATLCRSLHFAASSALLGGGSGRAAEASAGNLLALAALSSLVACLAALPAGLVLGEAPGWPAAGAPLMAAVLLLAPLGEAVRLGVPRHASPFAAAALEAAVRPLAQVAAAACLGGPLAWGQPVALVALLCGAALLLGRPMRAKAGGLSKAELKTPTRHTMVLLGRERLLHPAKKP